MRSLVFLAWRKSCIPRRSPSFFSVLSGLSLQPCKRTLHVSGGRGSHQAGLVMDTSREGCVHLRPFHTCIPLCQPVTPAETATCIASQHSGLPGKRLGSSPTPRPSGTARSASWRGAGKPGEWDALRAQCHILILAGRRRPAQQPPHAGGGG